MDVKVGKVETTVVETHHFTLRCDGDEAKFSVTPDHGMVRFELNSADRTPHFLCRAQWESKGEKFLQNLVNIGANEIYYIAEKFVRGIPEESDIQMFRKWYPPFLEALKALVEGGYPFEASGQ